MLSNPLVRLMGYLFFISPPKALEIVKNQPADGELKNLPVWVVVLLEGLIRIGLLLVISTTIQEYILGKEMYETMHLDDCFSLIAFVGLFHFAIYYLLAVCSSKRSRFHKMLGLYRLLRNLGYSALSGLPFYALGNLAIAEKWVDMSLTGYLLPATLVITILFAFAGVIESLVRQRMPLGLDDRLGN
jgi:predicted neutral ceramidase superfamily lipid hydrolase